jgi:xylulokinase
MQIVSDIAGIEQHLPVERIGACYGGAFLAGVGARLFTGIADAARWVRIGQVVRPDTGARRSYDGNYRIYRDLYSRTASLMKGR